MPRFARFEGKFPSQPVAINPDHIIDVRPYDDDKGYVRVTTTATMGESPGEAGMDYFVVLGTFAGVMQEIEGT